MSLPSNVCSGIDKDHIIETDDLKNRILYWSQNDAGHGEHTAVNSCGSSKHMSRCQMFCEMHKILDPEVKAAKCDTDDNFEVSIWVSFVKIYNMPVMQFQL